MWYLLELDLFDFFFREVFLGEGRRKEAEQKEETEDAEGWTEVFTHLLDDLFKIIN